MAERGRRDGFAFADGQATGAERFQPIVAAYVNTCFATIAPHTDAARRASIAFDIAALPDQLAAGDLLHQLIGHAIGRRAGNNMPVLLSLPDSATSDN